MGELADRMTDELARLAPGNWHAAMALCRMAMADDPDAEARRITAEAQDTFDRLAALMMPVVEQYNAWVAEGVEAAEDHGNRP